MKFTFCVQDDYAKHVMDWAFADLKDLVETHTVDMLKLSGDAVVSPANSFGFMTGGIDLGLRGLFGRQIEWHVQRHIVESFGGELKVGEALTVKTGHAKIAHMIVAPTMRLPMPVADTMNAYLAMKAVTREAKEHQFKTILLTGLGTGTGQIPWPRAAAQMRMGLVEVL